MQEGLGLSEEMRNDAGSRSPRFGVGTKNGSSKLMRAISSYLRSVSSNAGNIAATVRTAGSSVAAATACQVEEDKHREQVQWASLDTLEVAAGEARHVLLLTYLNGFQVWDVEDASNVRELVSKRDGRAAFLRLVPQLESHQQQHHHSDDPAGGEFKDLQPLLLVITGDQSRGGGGGGGAGVVSSSSCNGASSKAELPHFVPTVVRFYSLKSHSYIKELRFRTGICAVRCSRRLIVVAVAAQIYCYDTATLQNTSCLLTYNTPNTGAGVGYGALAVGPRWMAYAANQPLMSSAGRVSPQHLISPGVSPSTSPASGGLVAHYAMESSKQLAAGIMTLGDMGYKTLSKYCSEFLPEGVSPTGNGTGPESEYVGTVIVRDYVEKKIIAQFRAHSSPISALCFDPSGTLLVTASVYGHNLNVFRLTPTGDPAAKASYVHLYKLCRGVTNAVIQDISFSHDSQWISVSTSRGTSHLFAISPFGGVVGPQTHGTCAADPFTGPGVLPTPAYPWWTSSGPLRASQQALPPPPPAITLSVVSRIKNGLGVWRGSGRSNGISAAGGAVAAGFHDGDSRDSEGCCLRDKLWVLCPSGHLTRYLLKPSTGSEAGGYSTEESSSPGQSQDLRLIVEASEKWDVCRRKDWLEREARIESRADEGEGASGDDDHHPHLHVHHQQPLQQQQVLGSGSGSGGGLNKAEMKVEELQRWYMSNAEVQISQARPLPIWAKPNVYFHALKDNNPDVEVEKLPHQVIEIRRKDLKPLVDRLQRLDKMNPGFYRNTTASSEGSIAAPKYRFNLDTQHTQIHRSSSGSSFGSEGPLADSSCGSNGFHHNYQGFSDVYISATSPAALQNDSFDMGYPSFPNGVHHHDVNTSAELASSVANATRETSSPVHATGVAAVVAGVGEELVTSSSSAVAPIVDPDPTCVKSETASAVTENEGERAQEDEVWEGTMFPFCDEAD